MGEIHELFGFGPFFGLVCRGDSWLFSRAGYGFDKKKTLLRRGGLSAFSAMVSERLLIEIPGIGDALLHNAEKRRESDRFLEILEIPVFP